LPPLNAAAADDQKVMPPPPPPPPPMIKRPNAAAEAYSVGADVYPLCSFCTLPTISATSNSTVFVPTYL
jgi:hypothetical protein